MWPVATVALSGTMLVSVARAADVAVPGVLIIHSNQRPTPAAIVIEDTLRKVVPDGLQAPVELFSEYLDIERASSTSEYRTAEADFLRRKYSERSISVIVASAPDAIRFATDFRDYMLPGVPVVHIAMPRDVLEQMILPAGVVGKTIDLDPTQTLRLAMRLQPGLKHVVIVLGAAARDRVWERRVRAAMERLGEGPQVEYLVGLTNADVQRRVGALPRGTIVYTAGYFIDGAGKVGTARESVESIAKASAVPVYGALDTFLGTGILGGSVTPYEEQARQAGAIVVRLLKGAQPAEFAPSSVAQVPMVDWRQLRRWNIDERLLPAGTVVMFREPTAWDKYGLELSIGVAVLLIQAGLIAALLFERRSRRRTAAALDESQDQMTLAAHAARLSSWVWDAKRRNGRPTAPSKQRFDPLKQQPIPFDEVVESVHSADRETVEHAVAKALATNEELDVEYRVVDPDGAVRWIAARGRAEKGNSGRLLGVALDITERKAADLRGAQDRTALRHMTRVSTIGQLSAAVAHQLNQPLAAILGNAEAAHKMLGRDNVDLVELREICKDIVSEDHRATDVLRRLSHLYKRGDIKIEQIDLNELIRETLDLLRTELLLRHVTPVTDFAANLPPIEGGHVELQQVVLNLVLNAADAMSGGKPEERSLTIRTESRGTKVLMYVVDRGPGIAPEHLKTVFDPFWSTKEGGMGMGLAICQSIVASHRGVISAENNADGGATFCVTLPTRQYT